MQKPKASHQPAEDDDEDDDGDLDIE